MRVLLTRPAFDAVRTAERLRVLGHQSMIDPVISIERVPFSPQQGKFSALVFTSANAVRIAAIEEALKPYQSLPVFTVGTRTAEVARECGYRDVAAAAGDIHALVRLLSAELRSQMQPGSSVRVLHLAGEDRAGDLTGALLHSGVRTETTVIYRARASEALQPKTVEALRASKLGAVLHYSERSAAIFVRLADRARVSAEAAAIEHYCLSPAVAAPLKMVGIDPAVAPVPDELAMLELLGA